MTMMIMDLLTVPPADIDIERGLDAEYIDQMKEVKEVNNE